MRKYKKARKDRPAGKEPESSPAKAAGPDDNGGSPEAKRLAAAILEVLAGGIRPSEAATAVGITTPRYYVLETRAVRGLIAACEPQPMGRTRDPAKEIERLQQKNARLAQECARYQALARAAQRTLGLSVPEASEAGGNGPGKGRRRRPRVRALKVAGQLKAGLPSELEPAAAATQGD